jgi:predicted ferric reductase
MKMNVHELSTDGSPKTVDLPGTLVESARQRTSIESQEFESSKKLRSKRPIESSVIKPSLECREDNAPGLSAADISPRMSAPEDELDKINMAVELSLIKSSLKASRTPALLPVGSALDKDCADLSLQTSDSDDEFDDTCDSMRDLFKKSYEYIRPGPLFRFAVNFYAERKLFVFFWIHFVATMIIWAHFALIKFERQKDAVPELAPNYWWKIIAPSLEFGSMHAILFQMALIPLTMARFSIAALSESLLDRFIPLNKAVRIHIHLGYTMVVIVFFATIFFFAFFGLLCSRGEQAFCDKFTSEIMCTGYGILAFMLIIAGTSHFRHRIPYEVFYVVHHLVFALYIITIAHTIDIAQRSNATKRSQTFKWFSSTLLYYVCDRAAMHMNHKYMARLESSSAVTGSDGSKMIILKLRRPSLFRFKPGQYAFLKLASLDTHWHPFSIASGPAASHLEFYIEVMGEKSWTGKLWKTLEGEGNGGISRKQIDIEIMGPYGTSLAKTENFSHALAIGTGTGIVPILSIFKQHVRQVMRLQPEAHFRALDEHQRKMLEVEIAEDSRKGSIAQRIVGSCRRHKNVPGKYVHLQEETRNESVRMSIRNSVTRRQELDLEQKSSELRENTKEMKKAAYIATRSIYGVVLLAGLPVIGIALLGLTISWNTMGIELHSGMIESLQALTVFFQLCFAIVALFVWDGNQFFAYIDVAICMVTPVANAYWFYQYEKNGYLIPTDLTCFCLLTGYMTARVWSMTVRPRRTSWQNSNDSDGVRTMERLEIVWVARSASLVSEILPDINAIWETLVAAWGEENARAVCRISIYVTDQDPVARQGLQNESHYTALSQNVWFGRPDFGRIIEDHSLELICKRRSSYSLLAFCGSPQLAQDLHHCKISNDMLTAITGNKKHQMEFVSESYGGVKKSVKKELPSSGSTAKDAETTIPASPSVTTTRKITAYRSDSKRLLREISRF